MGKTAKQVKVEWPEAAELADKIVARLHEGCERLAVAGSVRRRKAWVGDIELVAVPKYGPRPGTTLWGEHGSQLDPILEAKVTEGKLEPVKGGGRYKQFMLHGMLAADPRTGRRPSIPLDLFLVRPEGFGYQLAIRTGPWQYSKRLVTNVCQGGLLDDGFRCHDGRVWASVDLLHVRGGLDAYAGRERATIDDLEHVLHPVPEETDFFELIRGGYVEPHKRR